MRTYDEMTRAALATRHAMLKKGQDPEGGKFFVTERERLVLLDMPSFMNPLMSQKRDRICGLKIQVISDGPPVDGSEGDA
jgi:hypothetical protein